MDANHCHFTLAFKAVQYKHRHDENNVFNSFMLYTMYNKQYQDKKEEDLLKTFP